LYNIGLCKFRLRARLGVLETCLGVETSQDSFLQVSVSVLVLNLGVLVLVLVLEPSSLGLGLGLGTTWDHTRSSSLMKRETETK